jgi:hypothetical protein
MKKICFVLFLLATPLFAQPLVSARNSSFTPMPAFAWTTTTHDFGKIRLNVPVTHEFRFTNTGDGPLIISSVQASCGCTVADYSKDPIAPGAEGYVKATYNAARPGVFSKTITVTANSEESVVKLIIKGEVEE